MAPWRGEIVARDSFDSVPHLVSSLISVFSALSHSEVNVPGCFRLRGHDGHHRAHRPQSLTPGVVKRCQSLSFPRPTTTLELLELIITPPMPTLKALLSHALNMMAQSPHLAQSRLLLIFNRHGGVAFDFFQAAPATNEDVPRAVAVGARRSGATLQVA